jgi:hypothetical protein
LVELVRNFASHADGIREVLDLLLILPGSNICVPAPIIATHPLHETC